MVTGAVVLHGDQGTLYTYCAFGRAAEDLFIKQSYSCKGNCWDNAVMEGWNGTVENGVPLPSGQLLSQEPSDG